MHDEIVNRPTYGHDLQTHDPSDIGQEDQHCASNNELKDVQQHVPKQERSHHQENQDNPKHDCHSRCACPIRMQCTVEQHANDVFRFKLVCL